MVRVVNVCCYLSVLLLIITATKESALLCLQQMVEGMILEVHITKTLPLPDSLVVSEAETESLALYVPVVELYTQVGAQVGVRFFFLGACSGPSVDRSGVGSLFKYVLHACATLESCCPQSV